jgi:hypothetical protein
MSLEESLEKCLNAIEKVRQSEKAKQSVIKPRVAPCVIVDEYGELDEEGKPYGKR